MVQIVRRKKKGRPSKADLARRLAGESPAKKPEIRRSHRRRNARYSVIDYDDYIDEDEEFEEDDEDEEENRRREKKLKLVVKLSCDEVARRGHAPPETEEDEESDGERIRKKRRINGGDDDEDEEEREEEEDEEDNGDGDGDGDENDGVEEDEEEMARKVDSKRLDSVPGTPTVVRTGIPLPDKKTLELILDKLQKKDTYGVYAEPVDPEELPDYHDVIEHPMDFATVRKRLADGFYSLLEQLESDVLLICSNAMQYNSSDTVYHKHARAIQELGRKKFEKLRIKFEAAEKETKLAQKLKSNSSVSKYESYEEENKLAQKIRAHSSMKKQIRKPMYRTPHETVGSDFSSGATLATAGEILNSMSLPQVLGCEKSSNNDVPLEPSNEINLDKAEETSPAKGFVSKLGRKPIIPEDNRRSTYNIPSQPDAKSESVFTTFESEIKQLVAVGLQAEYAYARSLARFAATLGPLAWKVASQRIEQALPSGYKFGRGWVGEYEPLPTPVLMLESHNPKQSGLVPKNDTGVETRKNERATKTGHFSDGRPQSEPKPSTFGSTELESEAKPSAFSSARARSEAKPPSARKSGGSVQTSQSRNFLKPEINPPKNKVELNDAPTPSQRKKEAEASDKRFPRNPEATQLQQQQRKSVPFKLPDSNGLGPAGLFPNGNDHRRMSCPPDLKPQADNPAAESSVSNNNAAAAAARAWMSIGAGAFKQPSENPKSQISAESLYNPARESQTQTQIGRVGAGGGSIHQFQPVPVPAFFAPQQHARFGNEAVHFQTRPVMMFPQMSAADLSRFQMQPPWHGLGPHAAQPRQKQDTLPPDLNIGFQSPPSPVKQSSGVLVESQQPDLALQL